MKSCRTFGAEVGMSKLQRAIADVIGSRHGASTLPRCAFRLWFASPGIQPYSRAAHQIHGRKSFRPLPQWAAEGARRTTRKSQRAVDRRGLVGAEREAGLPAAIRRRGIPYH